jgi:mycothiol synthase
MGYAHLAETDDGFACEVVTATDAPDRDGEGVTAALVAGVVAGVAGRGGGRLDYFLPNPTEGDETLAEALGFAPIRTLLVLRRPNTGRALEPAATPAVVPFRVGVDEDAWLTLNARAFVTHPEQGRWTRTDLDDREAEPWFDPAGFLCCWIDGQLAASCWTKRHGGDDPVGEIYVMSVDPDFQGSGLGRHLLAHGLASITSAGLPATILYVEGDNDPALGLYRAFDFAPTSRTVVRSREVAGS